MSAVSKAGQSDTCVHEDATSRATAQRMVKKWSEQNPQISNVEATVQLYLSLERRQKQLKANGRVTLPMMLASCKQKVTASNTMKRKVWVVQRDLFPDLDAKDFAQGKMVAYSQVAGPDFTFEEGTVWIVDDSVPREKLGPCVTSYESAVTGSLSVDIGPKFGLALAAPHMCSRF